MKHSIGVGRFRHLTVLFNEHVGGRPSPLSIVLLFAIAVTAVNRS